MARPKPTAVNVKVAQVRLAVVNTLQPHFDILIMLAISVGYRRQVLINLKKVLQNVDKYRPSIRNPLSSL